MKTQTILITGATTGLGRGFAIALAKRGHHVIATGRRKELLDSLKAEASGKVDVFTLDVTKKESIANARTQVAALTNGRGIDVLVNNAGFGILAPFEMTTDEELRGMFETNVFGLTAMTRAFLPEMRARGRGKIVNVSSVGGRLTLPFFGAYNATKYAVESMSDAMRVELKSFGIDVVLIEPGATNTEFNSVAFASDALGDDQPKQAISPYASALVKLAEMRATVEKTAASADSVVRGMVSAVEARSPRARYVLPSYNLLGIFFKSILPTVIWDFVLGAATGLRSLPKPKSDSSTHALAS
ncbi:MAG TPA: SDR family oxidoreductase [Polyangiaceae bacterium]